LLGVLTAGEFDCETSLWAPVVEAMCGNAPTG
jgi:hypothetical protein